MRTFAVALSYGVMVAQQVLVLFVVVRIRLGQRKETLTGLLFFVGLLQSVVAETAPQTSFQFTIAVVQLKQGLRIGCSFGFYTAFCPQSYVGIVLGRQLVKKGKGALYEVFLAMVLAVGKEHWHDGIHY